MNFKTICLASCAAVSSGVILSGCNSGSVIIDTPIKSEGFKLDTIVSVSSYDNVDKQVIDNALNICDTYADLFSMYDENSLLWKINHNITDEMPAEMGHMIDDALKYSSMSDGAFQLSIGSVSELWDFTNRTNNSTVPSKESIDNALKYVDDSKVSVHPKDESDPNGTWVINKPSETKLDLGAVSKGYIADKIKVYLLENNVHHAIINLGGNVLCVGGKGDESFNIGVQKPFGSSSDTSATLSISDMSVVSSGTYQRGFTASDGKYYHHILDARTGYPIENNLLQTTIISKNSFEGDCLSTLTFILGLEKGMELINKTDNVEAVFITNDYNLHYSDNAKGYVKE